MVLGVLIDDEEEFFFIGVEEDASIILVVMEFGVILWLEEEVFLEGLEG